jgi:hypothetical protein
MCIFIPDKCIMNGLCLIMSSTQLSSAAKASKSDKKHSGLLARHAAEAAAAENPA